MLDWRTLAQPVAGGHDTQAVLELAAARGYRRPAPGVAVFLDGAVTLEHVYAGESWTPPVPDAPAALTPAIATADVLLGLSPVLREQTKQLVHAIHPATVRAGTAPVVDGASRSHSLEHRFGTLWSTIDCPFGLAQSIVHEMAHQKLRALGLPVEGSGILIANPVSELYPSPILPRDRPMSAVLHATYSFTYVLELDLACLRAPDRVVRQVALLAIDKNLERVEHGYLTLRRKARLGDHGAAFFDGLFAWIERLVGRGRLELTLAAPPARRARPAAPAT